MSIYSLFDFSSFLWKLKILGNFVKLAVNHIFPFGSLCLFLGAHWDRLNKVHFPSGFNLMSFDNNIGTMISEIQWNSIVKIAFNFFSECRIMDWIYFFSVFRFESNRNCEMRTIL